MRLVRCQNGHYYDAERFSVCPHCGMCGIIENDPLDKIPEHFRKLGKVCLENRGASGTVYAIRGDETYALKEIDCGNDFRKYQCAQREIRVMEMLQGVSGATQLLGSSQIAVGERKYVYILEPYYTSLSTFLKNRSLSTGGVLRFGLALCKALIECQKVGVLHLDVQPKNIYLENLDNVRLGDFGLVQLRGEIENESIRKGTMAYIAPETYEKGIYNEQAVVYSIGLVLYALFNGQILPFMDEFSVDEAIQKRLGGEKLPTPKGISLLEREPVEELLRILCTENLTIRPRTLEEAQKVLQYVYDCVNERQTLKDAQAQEDKECADSSNSDSTTYTITGASEGSKTEYLRNSDKKIFYEEVKNLWSYEDSADCLDAFDTNDCFDVFTNLGIGEIEGSVKERNAQGIFTDSIDESRFFDADSIAYTAPCFSAGSVDMTKTDSPRLQSDEKIKTAVNERKAPKQRKRFFGAVLDAVSGWKIGEDLKKAQSEQENLTIDRVEFSAVAPKILLKGDYSILHLMMYEVAFRKEVDALLKEADVSMQETKSGVMQVQREKTVRVVLSSPDAEVLDDEDSRVWQGGYLDFSFSVQIPETYSKRQVLFRAQVYIDGVLATRLTFTAECVSPLQQKLDVLREDVLSAFISYASEDRAWVLTAVEGMKKARSDLDVFVDVEKLRSGEDWRKRLYAEIDRRDILYLFWSCAASRSLWVDREWRYAKDTKGIDAVEPVPLDPPSVCPPPKELEDKHFNESALYIIQASKHDRT